MKSKTTARQRRIECNVGGGSDDGDEDEISTTQDLGCLGSAAKAKEELGGGQVEDLGEGEEIKRWRWRNLVTEDVGKASSKDDDALARVTKPQRCYGEDDEASEGFAE